MSLEKFGLIAPPGEPNIKSNSFKLVGLVPSLRCNIKCRHCAANAGPDRIKELDSDVICRVLDEAKKLDEIKNICISGGEPFIYGDLAKIVQKADKLFPWVIVLTNCSWANDSETAKRVLRPLAPFINTLGVSADDFHQQFIPIEHVRNAIAAARYFNLWLTVQSSGDPKEPITERELAVFRGKASIRSGPVHPMGRAANFPPCSQIPMEMLELMGCARSELSPAVVPSGNVYGCDLASFRIHDKTHPMILGNVHESSLTDMLLKAKHDPVLDVISQGRFKSLVNVVRAAGLGDKLLPEYPTICDLCVHLLGDADMREALYDFYSSSSSSTDRVHEFCGLAKGKEIKIAVRELERSELVSLRKKSELARKRRNRKRQKSTREQDVDFARTALELLNAKALVDGPMDLDSILDVDCFQSIVTLAFGPHWREVC